MASGADQSTRRYVNDKDAPATKPLTNQRADTRFIPRTFCNFFAYSAFLILPTIFFGILSATRPNSRLSYLSIHLLTTFINFLSDLKERIIKLLLFLISFHLICVIKICIIREYLFIHFKFVHFLHTHMVVWHFPNLNSHQF
jgi:hypothetical protein